MKYPIAIEAGNNKNSYGVVIPDLKGCFSAGDSLDEAIDKAKETAELWLETVIDDGETIPEASAISELQKNKKYKGWIWAVIDLDISTLSYKTERINITLPARILRRIDKDAKKRRRNAFRIYCA